MKMYDKLQKCLLSNKRLVMFMHTYNILQDLSLLFDSLFYNNNKILLRNHDKSLWGDMVITRALRLESILGFIVEQSPKTIKPDPKSLHYKLQTHSYKFHCG